MNNKELKEIRELALKIAGKTYQVKSDCSLSDDQLEKLSGIVYNKLVDLIDVKREERYILTDSDLKWLNSEFQKIIDDITEDDFTFTSKQLEIVTMCKAAGWWNKGEPITETSVIDDLKRLFQSAVNFFKRNERFYYIGSECGWQLEIDLKIRMMRVTFQIYDSNDLLN